MRTTRARAAGLLLVLFLCGASPAGELGSKTVYVLLLTYHGHDVHAGWTATIDGCRLAVVEAVAWYHAALGAVPDDVTCLPSTLPPGEPVRRLVFEIAD